MNKSKRDKQRKNKSPNSSGLGRLFLAVLTALAPTLSHAVADGTIAGTGKGNLAVGTSSKVGNANDAVYATAVGFEAQATENYSTALGVLAQATKTGSLALGSAQKVSTRTGTVTLTTTASGINSIALGPRANGFGSNAVAIGNRASSDDMGTAVGNQASAGYQDVAIGTSAESADRSVALCANASVKATIHHAVALGYSAEATENYTVSVGDDTTTRRIVNVTDGVNDQDAATVKQLKAVTTNSGAKVKGGNLNTEINDRKAADAALNQRINRNRAAIDRNSQGIANTAAIAGMAPLPNGAESGLTLGLSQYSGMQGLAIGYLHRLNESFTVKAAMATGNTGQPVSTLGLAYTWGANSSDRITSHALQVRLHSTASELVQAKAEREQAKIKNERLHNKVNRAEAEAAEAKAKADSMQTELAQAHSLLTDLLQRMAALERKQKLGPLTREDAKLKPSTSLSPAPTQSR